MTDVINKGGTCEIKGPQGKGAKQIFNLILPEGSTVDLDKVGNIALLKIRPPKAEPVKRFEYGGVVKNTVNEAYERGKKDGAAKEYERGWRDADGPAYDRGYSQGERSGFVRGKKEMREASRHKGF